VRASQEGLDDYKAQRDREDREHRARQALIDAYLAVPAAGLSRAVIETEAFKAIAELRKVNKALREAGFEHPLGAQGVEDVIGHLGEAQLHEDQLPLVVEMVEAAMQDAGRFGGQEYQDVAYYLRHAAGGE
jgi:hypothetical protein